MIPRLLFDLIESLLSALDGLIPDSFEFPFTAALSQFSSFVGNGLHSLTATLPIDTMISNLQFLVFTYYPVKYFYVIVIWIYAHIPVIGNGGG